MNHLMVMFLMAGPGHFDWAIHGHMYSHFGHYTSIEASDVCSTSLKVDTLYMIWQSWA